MRIIRILGSIALWIGALLGVAAGGVWVAGQLGYVQPMVVISGSMEPGIMTGDLLIGRFVPTDQVEVGDVLSVPSELTGKLVTHRVTSIDQLDAEGAERFRVDLSDGPRWELRMKGDANADGDLEPYFPGDEVLTPWVQIPQGGKVVSKVMEPSVALPILLALVALLGLSLLDEPRRVVRRAIDRVRQPDPRLDDLDLVLATVGVDVARLRHMNDLDLQLYSLGVELGIDTDLDTDTETDLDTDLDTGDEPVAESTLDGRVPPRLDDRGIWDPLRDFELPPSDGIYVVRWPGDDPPTPSHPAEPIDVDQRTPARSG